MCVKLNCDFLPVVGKKFFILVFKEGRVYNQHNNSGLIWIKAALEIIYEVILRKAKTYEQKILMKRWVFI